MSGEAATPKSLGMRTEMAVSNRDSRLERRDGYWVMRTPGNPHYWMGNSLVFDAPPRPGDFTRWMELFERELGDLESKHRVFQIDSALADAGDSAPFVEAGFEVQRTDVLTTDRVMPPEKLALGLEVRPVQGDAEWQAVLELSVQIAVRDEDHEDDASQWDFRRLRIAALRAMTEQGLGHMWGGFLEGALVAKLGLFHVDELSRFQVVATDRAHRRGGICGTLVYQVSRRALAARTGRRLVMCAFEDYHATRIYQSLGFRITEHHVDYVRRPTES